MRDSRRLSRGVTKVGSGLSVGARSGVWLEVRMREEERSAFGDPVRSAANSARRVSQARARRESGGDEAEGTDESDGTNGSDGFGAPVEKGESVWDERTGLLVCGRTAPFACTAAGESVAECFVSPTSSCGEGAWESREAWVLRSAGESNPAATPSHGAGAVALRDAVVNFRPRRTRLDAARVRRAGLSADSQVLVREPAA